jgi:hypothetical protein
LEVPEGMISSMTRLILSVTGLIVCGAVVLAAEPQKDPCDSVSLPEALKQMLAKKYPTWQAAKLSDLFEEQKQAWLESQYHRDRCPGIAIGHFESKTDLSYAIMLFKKGVGEKLIVASKKKGIYRAVVLIESERGYDYSNTVYTVQPGKYKDVYEDESVTLTLDGFQLEVYEKHARMFYWKKGKYRSLVIMD